MKSLFAAIAAIALLAASADIAAQESPARDAALDAAIAADWRSDADKARDQHRHPYESLTFWSLAPGPTVVEINPGGGAWWTPILARYAHLSGGTYIAGYNDLSGDDVSENARNGRAAFLDKFSDANTYGAVTAVDFGRNAGLGLPDNSADLIMTARNVHNWIGEDGPAAQYFAEFARVLKPGGVLGVIDHRADEGSDPLARTGYLPEAFVIALAEAAGLVLDARSEINANLADDHDHPFGVWTLPPVARTSPFGQPADPEFDRAPYDAIGESDRMTLRFVKPN
jgi:predicted methyltransferase